MIETYANVISQIDELINFLTSIEIEAEYKSHLENDYLIAHNFYDEYKINPMAGGYDEGRVAMEGLHELYKWIWAVKDLENFVVLKNHLALLVQAAPRINSTTPFLNPVSGKQDDKTNKFIEAIVGFFAVRYGTSVALDDPIHSSGGDNPDALFDFNGRRFAIACKTLGSNKPDTILGNIQSAAKQITRANCDIGYILLNTMNILDHNLINGGIYYDWKSAHNALTTPLIATYQTIISKSRSELDELFQLNPKVCPLIILVVHSTTRIHSSAGVLSTSIKSTFCTDFSSNPKIDQSNLVLPDKFNEFIHNRY